MNPRRSRGDATPSRPEETRHCRVSSENNPNPPASDRFDAPPNRPRLVAGAFAFHPAFIRPRGCTFAVGRRRTGLAFDHAGVACRCFTTAPAQGEGLSDFDFAVNATTRHAVDVHAPIPQDARRRTAVFLREVARSVELREGKGCGRARRQASVVLCRTPAPNEEHGQVGNARSGTHARTQGNCHAAQNVSESEAKTQAIPQLRWQGLPHSTSPRQITNPHLRPRPDTHPPRRDQVAV